MGGRKTKVEELNWNDEFVPLNWMVEPSVLAKLRVSCAWLVTADRANPAMATANDLIGFMISGDSFRWLWRVKSTTVSDWLLLIVFLRGPFLNPGYPPGFKKGQMGRAHV